MKSSHRFCACVLLNISRAISRNISRNTSRADGVPARDSGARATRRAPQLDVGVLPDGRVQQLDHLVGRLLTGEVYAPLITSPPPELGMVCLCNNCSWRSDSRTL